MDAPRSVRVDDRVDDLPVVDGCAVRFGAGVRAALFEVGSAVAAGQQVVGAEIDLAGPQRAKGREQRSAVAGGRVVRLVGTEEPPDRRQGSNAAARVDMDGRVDRLRRVDAVVSTMAAAAARSRAIITRGPA